MGFVYSGHNVILNKHLRPHLLLLIITILLVVLIYLFITRNIKMRYYNSRSLSSMMKQTLNSRMLNIKENEYALKLNYDNIVHRINAHDIYGCPECHASSLSCHVGWRREKLERIRELWISSFHSKLLGDPFNYCYSFFLKGECLMCHPALFDPDNRKMPNYRRL